MKLSMDTAGGRKVGIEVQGGGMIYLTIHDLEAFETHVRLTRVEVRALIALLEMVDD